ncbi:MAG: glycosyltransferase [Candidatus Tyrphobacter sp.]
MGAGSVSVIVPAFNESECLLENLREAARVFATFATPFEIIVVDDGSSDGTHLAAKRALCEHPRHVRVVRYDSNKGKGNALMAGVSEARGEYAVFLDADMDLHPRQLPTFFALLQSQGADAVIGSKWHAQSRVRYPAARRFYSKCYAAAVRLLFGLSLRDTQTGLKLYRMALLNDVLPWLLVKRFAFDIELLAVAHARGYTIVDAPVTLDFQRSMGRVRLRDAWLVLVDTLAIFYRLRLLHYYDRPTPQEDRGRLEVS